MGASVLQSQLGKGPLCVGLPQDSNGGQRQDASSGSLNVTTSQLPGSLTVKEQSQSGASTAGCLHIADFVSSSLFVEEEAELGGGVTLKLNTGPKLETVSPAMWITATSRIGCMIIEGKIDFDTIAYLRYTEMMGELAARYTWQSVLLFDEEYRQRQVKHDFTRDTPGPHVSTVMLRDRDRTIQTTTATTTTTTTNGAKRGRPATPTLRRAIRQRDLPPIQPGCVSLWRHLSV